MPYTWSINNVVMGENIHTALGFWRAGRGEEAFRLTKAALLASMFMGICPGNVGSMNYLDVYRRESQRDFADGAGALSRALVEGLFGVQPDALAGELLLRPGFPSRWDRASLKHPSLEVALERKGSTETYRVRFKQRAMKLRLHVAALRDDVAAVRVNDKPGKWINRDDEIGSPRVEIIADAARTLEIQIDWRGETPAPSP